MPVRFFFSLPRRSPLFYYVTIKSRSLSGPSTCEGRRLGSMYVILVSVLLFFIFSNLVQMFFFPSFFFSFLFFMSVRILASPTLLLPLAVFVLFLFFIIFFPPFTPPRCYLKKGFEKDVRDFFPTNCSAYVTAIQCVSERVVNYQRSVAA